MKPKPVQPRRQILYSDGRIATLPGPISIEKARELIGAESLGTVALKGGVNVMLIDDDGIFKELPYNYAATLLYHAKCGNTEGTIHGDAIVVPDSDYA